MREHPDRRHIAVDGCWDCGRHVAVLVELGVGESELFQLPGEQSQEVELLGGARIRLAALRGLGVDTDVAQEALGGILCEPADELLLRRLRCHSASV